MFNFTCDEQHLSNATNNSNLGNEMASQPLISNTFLGGACVASANERPITNVSEPGLCKRVGQSWHSSFWLLQTSSCLMWRILGPIWACVRTVCAFQVQTSRACCLSCKNQNPATSNILSGATLFALHHGVLLVRGSTVNAISNTGKKPPCEI